MTVPEKSQRKRITVSGFANPLTHDVYLESEAHLKVYADATLLALGVDYTVGSLRDPAGYEVTMTLPISGAPTYFVLSVEPPIEQANDVSLGGVFGARYENALDDLTRRTQSLADKVKRSAKLPKTASVLDEGPEFLASTPAAPLTLDSDLNIVSGEYVGGVVATTYMAGVSASADDALEARGLLGVPEHTTFMAGLNASADDAPEARRLLGLDMVAFTDLATFLADAALTYASVVAGQTVVILKENLTFTVAAAGAADHDATNGLAGVVKYYVNPTPGEPMLIFDQFGGAPAASAVVNDAAFAKMLLAATRTGCTTISFLKRGSTYNFDLVSLNVAGLEFFVPKGVTIKAFDPETKTFTIDAAGLVVCGRGKFKVDVPVPYDGYFDGAGGGIAKAFFWGSGADPEFYDVTFEGIKHIAVAAIDTGVRMIGVKADGGFNALGVNGEAPAAVNHPGFVWADTAAGGGSKVIVVNCEISRVTEGVQVANGTIYDIMICQNKWRQIGDHCVYAINNLGGGIIFNDNSCVNCQIAYTGSYGPQMACNNIVMIEKELDGLGPVDPLYRNYESGILFRNARQVIAMGNLVMGLSAGIEVAYVSAGLATSPMADIWITDNVIEQTGESQRTGSIQSNIKVSNNGILDPATDMLGRITIARNILTNRQLYFEAAGADTLIAAGVPRGVIDVRGFIITAGGFAGTRVSAADIDIVDNVVFNYGRMLTCYVALVKNVRHERNKYINIHAPGAAFTNYMFHAQNAERLLSRGNIYRNGIAAPNLTIFAERIEDLFAGAGVSTGMSIDNICDFEEFTLAAKNYFSITAASFNQVDNICDLLSPRTGTATIAAAGTAITVTNINARSNSKIMITPRNAAAANLEAASSAYVTPANGSFTITSPVAAVGASNYDWIIH